MDIHEVRAVFVQHLTANETESRDTIKNHRSTMKRFLGYARSVKFVDDMNAPITE